MRPIELICSARPPSVNNRSGKGRPAFDAALLASYAALGRPHVSGLLFGSVIWFVRGYRVGTDPDADNISKAVWDSLRDFGAFDDDKQVRLRSALILDLVPRAGDFVEIDLLGAGDRILGPLNELLSTADIAIARDLTVIRFGRLGGDMLRHTLAMGQS